MDFDLDNLNPATRFYLNDDKQEDGWIELRVCNAQKLAEFKEKTTKVRPEYRRGVRHEVVNHDEVQFQNLFFDYVITEWDGLTDKGEPIDCTKENKIKLVNGSVWFLNFVNEKLEVLNDRLMTIEKDAEKN